MSEDKINRAAFWLRWISAGVLVAIVLGRMADFWINEPPDWFMVILVLLALGVEGETIKNIALAWVQKQADKTKP